MANPGLKIYLNTSFVGDLGYQAPTSQVAGMEHTLVTGRKTWKTSKGKNEAVWPSHIEAALFDALEKYRPASSGDPRLLRRFPKRNRFISDHILKVTGKVRTPKQVGSRLQQLRDTCQEEKVLKLLSRREFPPDIQTQALPRAPDTDSPTGTVPSLCGSASTSPASSPFSTEFPDIYGRTVSGIFPDRPALTPNGAPEVAVELVPSHSPHPTGPLYFGEFNLAIEGPYPVLRDDQCHVRPVYSEPLNNASPSVKFVSPTVLQDVRSVFCVFLGDKLVHNEYCDLELLPGVDNSDNFEYCAQLIPSYWPQMCMEEDLSRYVITHDLMRVASIDADQTMQEALLFSVRFKFESKALVEVVPALKSVDYPNPLAYDYGVSQLGVDVPIFTPHRTLLLDTANTMISGNQTSYIWGHYDSTGIALPTTHSLPYDFMVGEASPTQFPTRLEPLDDNIHYLNLGYTWWYVITARPLYLMLISFSRLRHFTPTP
ncbi:hypothetical protein H0H81_005778 [Sphagnurus paluster]|uniref:TEA domain-containing protein n=1 Tax=Sphagnurus paluster TaxID=117069 RepID=A0A9P7K5N7_9AGAR|nr:hypothetical protein H0H81_005778 [Sphagnurus paluster]